ncbi:hypothetical protein [Roseobacter sp. HKCCA0434]|uniref:hypothetical protein n=1 Tax=Roseobacter sp. HKCCA0434 TaxID=3079297 RepID=UPI002905996B|nr:hypothetical protein [Roseobacter sp. HKCCA0434]
MTALDIAFLTAYSTSTVFVLAFVAYLLRTAGRPRPHDPEAVDRLIEEERSRRAIAEVSPKAVQDDRVDQYRYLVTKSADETSADGAIDQTPQEYDLDAAAAALGDVCRRFNIELRGTPTGVQMVRRQKC